MNLKGKFSIKAMSKGMDEMVSVDRAYSMFVTLVGGSPPADSRCVSVFDANPNEWFFRNGQS